MREPLEVLNRLRRQVDMAIRIVESGLLVDDPEADRFRRNSNTHFSIGDFEIVDCLQRGLDNPPKVT